MLRLSNTTETKTNTKIAENSYSKELAKSKLLSRLILRHSRLKTHRRKCQTSWLSTPDISRMW